MGRPLTTRCPGTLHPGSRSLAPSHSSLGQHTLASFFPGPGSWGPDTDRLAWYPTQTRPQLPLSTHLPFSETKSHLVSVSLQLYPVSLRTKSTTHPAGSRGGGTAPHPGGCPGKDAGHGLVPLESAAQCGLQLHRLLRWLLPVKAAVCLQGCELPGTGLERWRGSTQPNLSLRGEAPAEDAPAQCRAQEEEYVC